MRYTVQQKIFAHTELEEERIEFLETLDRYHPWLRKEAESVLGKPVRQVMPCGEIVDPVKFQEQSDIMVAFHLGNTGKQDPQLTAKLLEHFSNLPIENIGTIVPIVYT